MLAKNESQMDRAIRLVVGLVLLIVGYSLGGGWLQIVLYVLAIIALITSATGTCWLYQIFGMNTAKGEIKTADSAEGYVVPKEEPKTMAAVEPEEESSDLETMEDEEAEEEIPAEETKEEEVTEEVGEVTEVAEEELKEEEVK